MKTQQLDRDHEHMGRLWKAITVGVACLVSVACGSENVSQCRNSAQAQAEAENAWSSELEAHRLAHVQESNDHAGSHEELTALRVNVIVATAATQRAC